MPDGPGLGVEVDEEALAQLAANYRNDSQSPPRCVGVLHLPVGRRWYTILAPDISRLTGCEEGTIRGIRLDLWSADGSDKFERVYEQVVREGAVKVDSVT